MIGFQAEDAYPYSRIWIVADGVRVEHVYTLFSLPELLEYIAKNKDYPTTVDDALGLIGAMITQSYRTDDRILTGV